ncbi:MAG: hypothetical protein Q8L00_07595 [Deltaproteobacteria bacterium]|nr:hypothetical protein [Deltaproteobacteria bacterium]
MPSYEFILGQFRALRGLYILGAGVSTGSAPLGKAFWTTAPLDYLRNLGSFSADIPVHAELTQKMIDNSRSLSMSEIFPDRPIRFGIEDSLIQRAILQRMPNCYARLYLKHCLSKFRFSGRQSDSYHIFRTFRRSLILNYNHDGLAADFLGQFHHVLDMHGTIDRRYGSPQMYELIDAVREYDLPDKHDGITMGVPESYFDKELAHKLLKAAREVSIFPPNFLAIIGYSFAQNERGYDDRVSLDCFLHTHRNFHGNIYVIGPRSDALDDLKDLIADGLKSKKVFRIRAFWNLLSHAFMKAQRVQSGRKSLDYVYNQILDTFGSEAVFPLSRD